MEYPIRVLNLFTIMNRGGAETMVMNYYRNIDRSRVQFDFLVHRAEEGVYEAEIRALGGRIYRMLPIYPQNFARYKKMLALFFREHPEYRIIHSHMSELGYFAFREAKRQGVPVRICHAHNAPRGWELKMFMRTYFKKAMIPYITDRFMCGKASGDWLFGKKYENQFIQLNNAIDAEKFRYCLETESRLRREYHLEDRLLIGHVGRFNVQKNHDKLIDIFAEIRKKRNDSVLVLIGEGNLEGKIREKTHRLGIEDSVLFLGGRDDVNEWMQTFDVFVFPSLFEGLGIAGVEAQAGGCLCVFSDAIPPECIVTDGVISLSLQKPAEEWAEIILDAQKNHKKRDNIDQIRNHGFDIHQNAKKLEEFYVHAYQRDQ